MVRKIKKKRPITAPDEFIALPNRILDYLKDNWQQLVNIGLGCLVIVCLIFIIKYWWQKKQQNTIITYARAEQLLQLGKIKEAKKDLKKVENSHTKIAKFAALNLAFIAEKEKDFKGAIKYYQTFLKKSGKNSFVPYILHAISCDYMEVNLDKCAQNTLHEIINAWTSHPMAAWAYVNLGLLLEKDHPREALNLYKKALRYKDNPFVPAWIELKIKSLSQK